MRPHVRPTTVYDWLQTEAVKSERMFNNQKARFLCAVAELVNSNTIGKDRAAGVMKQIDSMLKHQGPSDFEMANAVVAIATLLNSFRS